MQTRRNTNTQATTRWLNTEQAAEYTGFTKPYLAQLRAEGGGPPFAKLSNSKQAQIRYSLEDLEAWMRSHVRTSTSDTGGDQ